jgi:hypothetical protein
MSATRRVILHADDVGMCHGANQAFLKLFRAGRIDCGSVMVPCPWFPEIAREAAADPSLDLGVHLTLTSEWVGYRWRPLTGRAPGLTDAEGFFPRTVPALRELLDVAAAAAEMRAQLETALAAGIDVTHLDAHMGAAMVPELLDATRALASEFRLPLLLPRRIETYLGGISMGPADATRYADPGGPIDAFAMTLGHPEGGADSAYRAMLEGVGPGLTYVAMHPTLAGEITAITAHHPRQDPRWRIEEAALLASGLPDQWLAQAGIGRTGMRALRAKLRA